MATRIQTAIDYCGLDDAEMARLCAARDRDAIRHVITTNNQRLFRAAWSILKNREDAEEAVQAAYLSAFAGVDGFEGRSALSTWLTRIVVNEALSRRRAQQRRRNHLKQEGVAVLDDYREALMRGSDGELPDAAASEEDRRQLLVTLTERGREAARTQAEVRDRIDATLLERVGEEAFRSTRRTLAALIEMRRGAADSASANDRGLDLDLSRPSL
jgi:RNA polymerase sigma factor (sigma-70 family)